MLKPVRHLAIMFSILSQAVLGVLGVGNLLNHLQWGVYLTLNALVAVTGLLSAVFISLVVLTERSQKEASTMTALFELIWVCILWAVTTVEASYISAAELKSCRAGAPVTSGKWDLCLAHSISVPLSWAAAFFATTHLVVLVVLIEWHRAKAVTLPTLKKGSTVPESQGWLKDFWRDTLKPEITTLKPIVIQSVYKLIQMKQEVNLQPEPYQIERPKTFIDRMSRVIGRRTSPTFDIDERVKLRWQDEAELQAGWTGSYYFQAAHANDSQVSLPRPVPVHEAPPSRFADLPRYQLRDEPTYAQPPLSPLKKPRLEVPGHRRRPSGGSISSPLASPMSPRKRAHFRASAIPPSPVSSAPSSPRHPFRSRTLPSILAPPRAQLLGTSTSPGLARSQTVGARGPIPSRYKNMDLSVPIDRPIGGAGMPPRPPPGFLPRPNGRY